jgi:hypothetical protein
VEDVTATPRRWLVALIVVAIVGATMAACSGGGNKDKTPAASGTPGTESTASGGGKNADAQELDALAEKFTKTSFKANYTLSSTSSEQPLDGTLVLYKDGADRFRFDITSQQDGQTTALTLIDANNQSVFCLQDAGDLAPILGVDQGKGVCIKNDPTDSAGGLGDILQNFKDLGSSDTTVTSKTTRTIAGQEAHCYEYEMKDSTDKNETCFSADGIPLYDKSVSDSDTTTMEATQLEGSVQTTDFNIPYEIKDLPDFGSGTPAP